MAKVVVIDDSEFMLDIIKDMLESLGYQTLATNAPEEFRRLIQEEHPDLVLVDEMMPTITGTELARELRKSSDLYLVNLPVVLTGIQSGGGGIPRLWRLMKPFSIEKLEALLAKILAI
ncbi:MAG: response regulator [Chloroflexi bacterium]|uniref:Response regulator n=1 Tax=Candidatus Chlorohelix allophototropha TaxID=3003348 RepID=A0A8T7LU20_9CHLR|nr:response regulator [Chloroflexota bacterium]WJW67386.1 response regulator [Chloroflexota bacterium L227-S17]